MGDPTRLSQLAREAGAYETERLPTVEPPRRDFTATSPADQQDARERLTLQRTTSAYYKDPNKQKRNVFRSKKEKAALNDTSGWIFTKVEKFAELDRQIRQGAPVGLAQAILTADSNNPLDVNASYVYHENGTAVATGMPNGWLDLVAERNDVNYVRLLTAFGASQQSKDRALGLALKKGAIGAIQELLRNNADPNESGVEYFMNAIARQDTQLIKIFLTAIIPLRPECISKALIATVCRGTPDLVVLLFAHGASGDYADGRALSTAIAGEQVEDAATILFHSNGALSVTSLIKATEAACLIGAESPKRQLLELLLCAGANPDTSTLQDQLLRAVRDDQRTIVELLIRYGTSPDRNYAESLRLAIAKGQTELMTVILQGPVNKNSASRALEEAKALEEIEQYEFVVAALIEKGVTEDSLHKCLADAVDKGCGASLAPMLISQGANLDYADAQCLRVALQQGNLSLLQVLLKGHCHPSILCKTLPQAMRFQPQSERFHVMVSLLEKDVSGKGLHIALQMLVGAGKDAIDYRLMGLLIRKNASVDFFDESGNCICIAVAQENEKALDLLTEGDPSADTVSTALGYLPVSFAKSEAADYERTVRMARLLLEKGAHGTAASKMLVKAVRDDYRGKALDLLLDHNADANHDSGKAIEEALSLREIDVLEQLCRRSKLDMKTFATQLPNALKPKGFNLQKGAMLARTAASYGYEGILDMPLLKEIQFNGSRKEIIELLLGLGASVNFQEGKALRHAVSKGDVETTRLLLPARPTTMNVARAFPSTMQIKDLSTRYALMQVLLHSGGPGMGDEALLQASHEANPEDLSHVELLLQHHASPDFKDGAPVLESIKAINLPLLDLFIKSQLKGKTLTNAFNLARKMQCSREERHLIFAALLKSGFDGFETSQALIEVVQRSPTDIETSVMLLEHGASVDRHQGRAMQIAASAGSLQLLNIFTNKGPHQKCCDEAFHAATCAQVEPEMRKRIYLTLLETRISRNLISKALFQATVQDPIDKSLLLLLIRFKASLDAEDGGAIYNVTSRGDAETLSTLLTGTVNRKSTLDRSFEACMLLKGEVRWAIAKQLLEKEPSVGDEVISHFLAQIVREKDHSLLSLMMKYGPDPSYNSGESLILAAQGGDKAATALLAGAKIPEETLNRAFESMLESRAIQSTPEGLETAGILLPLGIEQDLLDRALLDGFDDPIDQKTKALVEMLIPFEPDFNGDGGKVLIIAARSEELELFRRMASQTSNLNVIIPSLIRDAESWTIEEEEAEVSAEPEDITKAGVEQTSEDGANVEESEENERKIDAQSDNTKDGGVESREPKAGEKDMRLRRTPEEKLVFYLQHLEECAHRDDHTLDDSVIFTAMMGFPQGRLLVKHLLGHGCPANSQIEAEVDPSGELLRHEPVDEVERLSAVIWALCFENQKISEDVVLEILEKDQDADISFETSITRHTATHIASAGGRCTVLNRLIEIGIDPSQCDSYQHSASFYASRNGYKEAVETLHAAGAKVDDGSLHEAAREAHFEIVEYLLANSHRADFPSSLHADGLVGRTALEELCSNSTPGEDIDDWKKRIHRCIEQLLSKNVKDVHKSHGKTMLHLALENSLPVTRALLEFPAVWENINHPIHLFQDTQRYYYSPTKYVEFFCIDASPETKQQLISLLLSKKCADKYYAATVTQPAGAVGLPPDIAHAVEKQKRADHEHSEDLKRQAELAARNRAIEAEDCKRKLATDKERHDLLARQRREQEDNEKQMAQRKQALLRSHAQELHREREAAIKEEGRLRQQALSDEASRRKAIQESELAHKRNVASEEYSASQSRLAVEQQLISERAKAGRAEAALVIDLLNRRESTARFEAQQRAASYSNNGY